MPKINLPAFSRGVIEFNPDVDRYWIIDARVYQPDQDGKQLFY